MKDIFVTGAKISFKTYLRYTIGSLRDFKKSYMNEPGHFKHDWIAFMNERKRCYKNSKIIYRWR